jgi:predicted ArsR family transcriptional regulator
MTGRAEFMFQQHNNGNIQFQKNLGKFLLDMWKSQRMALCKTEYVMG